VNTKGDIMEFNYADYVKSQLTAEQFTRLEQQGLNYLDQPFSGILSDLANFDERIPIEIPFIIRECQMTPATRVLDTCLGTGATSIGLQQYGITNVISNEPDVELQRFALNESKKRYIALIITDYYWQELSKHFNQAFDVEICTGNSLTEVLKTEERKKSLHNFYDTTKKGGFLVIDTRNYNELLKGNFVNTTNGPYRGKNINITPIYVATDMILMRYQHRLTNVMSDLVLYPLTCEELRDTVRDVGYKNLTVYGDYQKKFNPKKTGFFTVIAQK